MLPVSYTSLFFTSSLTSCLISVLDVHVLSTDGQVQDFRFPQTSKGGATLQLSSNTVKVNSKNGKKTPLTDSHILCNFMC